MMIAKTKTRQHKEFAMTVKTNIQEFDLEECNGFGGMPWIFYKGAGKDCQEPVIISFKDIFTLFRNEGIEPDDNHNGRYHFSKTTIALGVYCGIELEEAFFYARELSIVE